MKRKKTSWLRAIAFTITMTMVLLTGATGLVVAEEVDLTRGSGGDGQGEWVQPNGERDGGDQKGHPSKVSISLDKKVDMETVHFKDETVQYTFTVKNNGDRDLTGVMLEDKDMGLEISIGDLKKKATYTTAVAFNLSEATWNGNVYENTASVEGTGQDRDNPKTVTASSTERVYYTPILKLEKSVNPKDVFFKDEVVKYTLKVTNQGCIDVSDIIITDPTMALTIPVGSLSPNGSYTTTVAFDLSLGNWEGNSFTNEALAQGTVPWKEEPRIVSAEASALVNYKEPLILTKTASKDTVNFKEDKVIYTFKVENRLCEDLNDVILYDETIGSVLNFGKIRGGKSATKTVEFGLSEVTWNGDGQFINTARVEAPYMRGDTLVTLTAIDTATVAYVPPMTLEKTVDPEVVFSKDGTVQFTFTIRNNMEGKEIKNVVLEDPLLGLSLNMGNIKAKSKWSNKGYVTTTVAVDLSNLMDAWDGNQLTNEATATGCYEKEVQKPRGWEGDKGGKGHGGSQTECIPLTATDTAMITYNPTTLTVLKDVPNVTDSTELFDVLISWGEGESIQIQISEMKPYIMNNAVPGVTYTVTETTKAGYTTAENTFDITMEEPGEDGIVTFVNTKDVVQEESSGGSSTNRSGGGGGTTTVDVPEQEIPLVQDPGEVVAVMDEAIPLADVPQTGSEESLGLWALIMALSGLGFGILNRRKIEKN